MRYIESMLLRDETILYVGRKHVVLMLGQIVTEIVLMGLTGVAVWLVGKVLDNYNLSHGTLAYVLYGVLGVAAVILIGSAIIDYLHWYDDCVVLTNERIMKFEGIFNRHMIESSLNKINDVALNQTLFGRLIGYGDIMILTAADTGLQEMRNMADPIGFKRALAEARVFNEKRAREAVTEAAVNAVEEAMDEAANAPHEHVVVDDDASHARVADDSPTPSANVRPTNEILQDMLMHPTQDDAPTDARDTVEFTHAHADAHDGDDATYHRAASNDTDAATHDHDEGHATDKSAHEHGDAPHIATADPAHSPPSTTLLSQLDALHAAGILNDAEYIAKRRQITGEEA